MHCQRPRRSICRWKWPHDRLQARQAGSSAAARALQASGWTVHRADSQSSEKEESEKAVRPMETWLPVLQWEGLYEVSDRGCVRSIKRRAATTFGMRDYGGRILKNILNAKGYCVVNLTRRPLRVQAMVHLLVLTAFRGSCPEGMWGCHNNGKPSDPRLENLRWDTPAGNHADKKLHGTSQTGARNGNSKAARALRAAL